MAKFVLKNDFSETFIGFVIVIHYLNTYISYVSLHHSSMIKKKNYCHEYYILVKNYVKLITTEEFLTANEHFN